MSTITDDERDILQAFADGRPAHHIAHDHGLPVTEMRDLLWRLCRFQDRIARLVLAEQRVSEPTSSEPEPTELAAQDDERIPARLDDELVAAGLTYRQLDYWFRTGLIQAAGDNTPGSGYSRRWTIAERGVALTIARLTRAGLTLTVAAEVARGQHEIGPGIRIVIDQAAS